MKLYGKIPVLERIKSNPKSIRQIYIQEGNSELSYIRKKAHQWHIPILTVPSSKMAKLSRSLNTQGVLVEVDDYQYVSLDDLLAKEGNKRPTLVFLDGVTDPQNFGGIIRSLACLGNFAAVVPTHDSVHVTESVLRVAAGGDNYVAVALVNNLSQAIIAAKEAGYWIAGAVVEGGQDLWETKLAFPLGLVVGSEQKGIRDVIRRYLDMELTIPMPVNTLSFNVAHAAAILCYEIAKQKKNAR